LDLNFAQKNGTLSLSVRHPDDNAGVEPIEETNLQTLFAKIEEERRLAEEAKSKPQPPTAWETIAKTISSRIDDLEKQLAKPVEQPQPKRVAVERIGKGMRAISIETPSESTGVAGLLEPGDRVDLHLTLSKQSRLAERIFSFDQQAAMPTERLIENIEVLAVDTNLEPQGEGEKKSMSRSVTVIVVDGMDRDITRAQEMGTLTLVLRGKEDSEPGVPRTLMTLDDFVTRYEPRLSVVKTPDSILVRTYRGQVADDVTFSNGDNSSKVSGF
jgi:Flp pilus assembly protein CpaB